MGDAQGLGQCVVALGQDNQMDMVIHQAIAQYGQMILQTVVSDPREVLKPIVIFLEDRLAAISPLGDVIRMTWNNDARLSWHEKSLHPFARVVKIIVSVPILSNPRLRTLGVSPGVKASDAGKIPNVGVVPQVPRA